MRMTLLLSCTMMITSFRTAQVHAADGAAAKSPDKQVFELRHYQLKSPDAAEKLDEHVREALIPALNRAGCQPIGFFATVAPDQANQRYLLIPYESLSELESVRTKLASDNAYQAAFESDSGKLPQSQA